MARHDEIVAAGISEVGVFRSTPEDLAKHVTGLPFAVVGNPRKGLYADFGVESSPRALLDPLRRVMASKLGKHVYDQWSVDELLAQVRSTGVAR